MSAAKLFDQTQQPDDDNASPSFPEWLWWLGFFCAIAFLLGNGLWFGKVPAFRDGYHFYYPQVVWYRQWLAAGDWFPTWNHQSLLGVSAAGQSSYSLFYPLRAMWYLPWLDAAQAYSLYILMHLGLAAAGMRFAARRLSLSAGPACLASFSYALSCPVFFQLNNLIYLTSAAWIGFALGCFVTIAQTGRWSIRDVLICGGAMSCMLLAGDPQTMIHCGLVVSVLTLAITMHCGWRWLYKRWLYKSRNASGDNVRYSRWQVVQPWCGLLATLALVVGLTAVQWIPMLRWANHSGRVQSPLVQAVSAQFSGNQHRDEELKETRAEKRVAHGIYDFSLSPWHATTLFFPTVGGHYQPSNSRVFAAIPAEGRMWIPAIYIGLLPAWLLLSGLIHRWRSHWGLWALLLFSLAAACGSYAPAWIARELARGCGWSNLVAALPADPVGGAYWMLVEFLPGYASLRYPAKWTVWFAAAACLLAAASVGKLSTPANASWVPSKSKRIAYFVLLGISLSGCGLAFTVMAGDWSNAAWIQPLNRWLAASANDAWLGSPVAVAFGQSLLIAFGVPTLSLLIWHRPLLDGLKHTSCNWLLAWTLVEMTLVAGHWCTFVAAPTDVAIQRRIPEKDVFLWADVSEANLASDLPNKLASTAQSQTDYQQSFALGKLHLLDRVASLHATESIVPRAIDVLRGELRRLDTLAADSPELSRRLASVGVTHRLVRELDKQGRVKFSWQVLEQTPLPMCRFISVDSSSDGAPPTSNSLVWRWTSADVLEISGHCEQPQRLLVRQFNDGGWRANIQQPSTRADISILSHAPQTLALDVPQGQWTISLTRRWLY